MKVNFFVCPSKHLINGLEGGIFHVSELVVTQVHVAEPLKTAEREADIFQLIVAKMNVEQGRKVTKHVLVFNFPDFILFKV